MKTTGLQRKDNIISNIEYIIRSRGESRASFANRTGVTRGTLYKILEGKVNNVQHSTVTRIANFFGVSCDIIENNNLETIELVEKTLSPEGDKNPAAIPLIPQIDFLSCFDYRIGELVTHYPVTWYFGEVSNMIAVQLENSMGSIFFPGDTLIIRRNALPSGKQLSLFHSEKNGIHLKKYNDMSFPPQSDEKLLGTIIEERVQVY